MRLLVRGQARSGTSMLAQLLHIEPEVCITHELLLYDALMHRDTTGPFLNVVCNQINKHRHKWRVSSDYVGEQDVVEQLREAIPIDFGKRDALLMAEKILYQGNRIFGDKIPRSFGSAAVSAMMHLNLDFALMYIHRDGRDVCASKFRYATVEHQTNFRWAEANVKKASAEWAAGLKQWEDFHNIYMDSVPILVLKFEDIVNDQEVQAEKIASFLDIDPALVLAQFKEVVGKAPPNIGYYKEWIPEWEKMFTDEAKESLERYGYK